MAKKSTSERVATQPKVAAKKETVPALDLGAGVQTCTPIYMKRIWGRDVPGVTDDAMRKGPVCIGYVTLREGVDLNLLVDAVSGGFAGEKPGRL